MTYFTKDENVFYRTIPLCLGISINQYYMGKGLENIILIQYKGNTFTFDCVKIPLC